MGLAIARRLAERGDHVLALARPGAALEEAIGALRAEGLPVTAAGADVRDAAALEAAFGALPEDAPLRTVVNAAGTIAVGPIEQMELEAWRDVMATNLDAAFVVCRAAIPRLRAAGGGAIVNLTSVAATRGAPFTAAYGASKAALVNLTQALAGELLPDGIRVCAISPGLVETDMGRGALSGIAASIGLDEPQTLSFLQGRWISPEEVADVVAWLSAAEASAVTGVHIVGDLGQTSRLL
jgi:NAD(P)-dependent dehydrogenase (short-subunit alcohol dehydrogenase family)